MKEGPGFKSRLVQETFTLEKKNRFSIKIKLLIVINCSHLCGVMGYVLGYRFDYVQKLTYNNITLKYMYI